MSHDDPFRSPPYDPSWNPDRDPSKDEEIKRRQEKRIQDRNAELRKFIEQEFARHHSEKKLKATGKEERAQNAEKKAQSSASGIEGAPNRTRTNQFLDFLKHTEGKQKKEAGKNKNKAADEEEGNENDTPSPPPEPFDPRYPDPKAQWTVNDPKKHDPEARELVLELVAKRKAEEEAEKAAEKNAENEAERWRKELEATSGQTILGLVIKCVDEHREKQERAKRKVQFQSDKLPRKEEAEGKKENINLEMDELIWFEGMQKREAERKKLEAQKKKAREDHPILDPFNHRDPESVRRALEVRKKRDAEIRKYLEQQIAKRREKERSNTEQEKNYKEKLEKERAK